MPQDEAPSVEPQTAPELPPARYQYEDGTLLEPIFDGTFKPFDTQLLVRAILLEDANKYAAITAGVPFKATEAVCHEIVAMGGGVHRTCREKGLPEEEWPQIGKHAFIRSTAGDRMAVHDLTCRFFLIDVADFKGGHWPEKPARNAEG